MSGFKVNLLSAHSTINHCDQLCVPVHHAAAAACVAGRPACPLIEAAADAPPCSLQVVISEMRELQRKVQSELAAKKAETDEAKLVAIHGAEKVFQIQICWTPSSARSTLAHARWQGVNGACPSPRQPG